MGIGHGDSGVTKNSTENLAPVERVNASTKEANDALDDALSFVAESNKRIAEMTGGRS